MAINFIKKIKEGNVDAKVHQKFIRFGLGEYPREDLIVKKGKNIELKGGFDYADVFMEFLAKHASDDVEVSGSVVSSKKIEEKLNGAKLNVSASRGKKYTIKSSLSTTELQAAMDMFVGPLKALSAKSGDFIVKSKPSPPKPGSLTEKFCSLKAPVSLWDEIKSEFLFDIDQDGKEFVVKSTYVISDVVVDEKLIESDPARARLEAKRKGVIKRELFVNKEKVGDTEIPFEA